MKYFYDRKEGMLVKFDEEKGELYFLERYELVIPHSEPVSHADEQQEVSTEVRGGGKSKKKKMKKGTRVCKKCGEPGHMQKTCPQNGAKITKLDGSTATVASSDASKRVKELLREGKKDDEISIETGTNIRAVGFIRKQMSSRGEI
jgi:hypothetical protein